MSIEFTVRSKVACMTPKHVVHMSTYEQWKCIIEIVGDPSGWPRTVRRLFWTQWLTSHQRCMLAAFSFVNGLPQPLLMHWCSALNLLKNKASADHLHWLFFVFRRGNAYNLYFAWNVKTTRYEYVSGQPSMKLRPQKFSMQVYYRAAYFTIKMVQTLSKKM